MQLHVRHPTLYRVWLTLLTVCGGRYIFTPTDTSKPVSGGWTQRQVVSKPANSEYWASSVALSPHHILFVGAPDYTDPAGVVTIGRVEVYTPAGGDPTATWSKASEVSPPPKADDPQGQCTFRFDFGDPGTLAVHGDTLAVGAPKYCLTQAASTAKQQGAVFVYTPSTPGDYSGWQQAAQLYATDFQDFGGFGTSVSIVASTAPAASSALEPADLIVVGSPTADVACALPSLRVRVCVGVCVQLQDGSAHGCAYTHTHTHARTHWP